MLPIFSSWSKEPNMNTALSPSDGERAGVRGRPSVVHPTDSSVVSSREYFARNQSCDPRTLARRTLATHRRSASTAARVKWRRRLGADPPRSAPRSLDRGDHHQRLCVPAVAGFNPRPGLSTGAWSLDLFNSLSQRQRRGLYQPGPTAQVRSGTMPEG